MMSNSQNGKMMRWVFKIFIFVLQVMCYAQSTYSQIANYHIGTKWIYETMVYPLPIETGYQTFEITDTIQFQGKSVFVIENDHDSSVEYMHVADSRVYFWDSVTDTFQLNFDFESDSSYVAYWEGACAFDSGTAFIRIDSTTTFDPGSGTIEIQHISIHNSGTTEEAWPIDVFKYIGPKYGGLRILFGYGFCDFPQSLGILRCFENEAVSYNFAGYACDSTWLSLSTSNLRDNRDIIYPNPTSGLVRITNSEADVPYELFDIQGRKVQSGIYKNRGINIERPGIFVLRLLIKAKWITRRIVVI